MVTPSPLKDPIDHKLWYIAAEIEDLPTIAEGWEQRTESSRLTFFLEWKELMDRVVGLEEASRSRAMTKIQQARYRKLLQQLKGHLPIIERLRLSPPRVALEV